MPTSSEYKVRVAELKFERDDAHGGGVAKVRGHIKQRDGVRVYRFLFAANYSPQDRRWFADIRNLRWLHPTSLALADADNRYAVAREVMKVFKVLWIRPVPGKNPTSGARIQVGQAFNTLEQQQMAFAIFRPDTLGLRRPKWEDLWPCIENRLANDPEFWVNGLTRDDALRAVGALKSVFPWEWVRRRYRNSAPGAREVGMWTNIFADQGFPAYLLARTAIGFISKDPGWNYLITLADSCDRLNQFPKGAKFLKRLASGDPGHIHQANFAGFLLERGLLEELEPSTGSGRATHDMAARVGQLVLDIEMKTFTSGDPARRLGKEIERKCQQLPGALPRPVVFIALILEASVIEAPKAQAEQLASFTSDIFGGAPGVSAVVVAQIFVEATGGAVRWNFGKFLINDVAARPVSEALLRAVFQSDPRPLAYPLLPIVFTFSTGDAQAASSSAASPIP